MPQKASHPKTLILHIEYGGLGDHLFFSHIPRIAKTIGIRQDSPKSAEGGAIAKIPRSSPLNTHESTYDKVYIYSKSPFRHADYKRLIWEANPYLDGFIDSPPTKRKFSNIHYYSPTPCNLLDRLMLSYGLDDGVRMHEPEIYYKPKFRAEFHKVIFDPNWISNAGDLLLLDILTFFKNNGIYIDAVMASKSGAKNPADDMLGKSLFDYEIARELGIEIIETPTLEDFCDLIYSAKEFYCFVTGSATLAAALRKHVSVLVGVKNPIDKIFLHSPLHRYYLIDSAKSNEKRVKKWRIFGLRFRFKLTNKRIQRTKNSIRKRFPRKIADRFARFLDSFESPKNDECRNLMQHIFAPPQRRFSHLPSHLKPCAYEVWNLIKFTQNLGIDISVVFEFGSRYGEDTIEFAKALPRARIYGFECNPNTLPHCQNATNLYKNITLTPKAISQNSGEISFYPINAKQTTTTHADGNQGASSTLRASGKYTIENYVQDEVKVEAIRLDDFMTARKITHIDILWMDIQGGELSALKSLGTQISRVKVIYSEVEFMEIYENQPLFSDIKAYLTEHNFVFVGFTGKSEIFTNAIFVHKNYANLIKETPSWIYKPKMTLLKRICAYFARKV